MEILKKISKDKLIIMVTHNPDLAEKYSSRIIKILDGKITDDSNPYEKKEEEKEDRTADKNAKVSMSFFTALSLSLNNLMTKKGRTFLTAFAGSIGIIGIALILSLSSGMQTYINRVEEDTLSSYPITVQEETIDMASMMTSLMGETEETEPEEGKVYSRNIVNDMLSTISTKVQSNNLEEFKKYLDDENSEIRNYVNAIQYSYNLDLNIYKENEDNFVQVNPSQIFSKLGMENMENMMIAETDVWQELLDNEELLQSQYDVLAGKWPEAYNEVVLIVDENNQILDYTLYALGLLDQDELEEKYEKILDGEEVEDEEQKGNEEINVFTGAEFPEDTDEPFDFSSLTDEQRMYLASLSQEEMAELMQQYTENAGATYEGNLEKMGVVDLASPSSISIYPKDFEAKDMIGIITYISVLERTKEIGILRSIGASKKDISRVFNAETFIVGLCAGLLGIGVTLLLNIPINIIIKAITDISGLASLPVIGGIILVLISMILTIIAGLIPAKMASKKDPVEALRTE